ncbi:MAG: DUF4160 domain-containing protein [Chitinophagales bacterium]|nr:DUF4160 domain-containing protein [Chitinophagales bacterium]
MPEISRFFGIIIRMFFKDHAPPHFHIEYNSYKAIMDIESQEIAEGFIPPKQLRLVQAWAIIHKDELLENFNNLNKETPHFIKIEPLH